MSSHTESFAIRKFNIGGISYVISDELLRGFPDSKLAHLNSPILNDEVFIDRNGELFQYILNYMRSRSFHILPYDSSLLELISIEAEYYGISRLVSICQSSLSDKERIGRTFVISTEYGKLISYATPLGIRKWVDGIDEKIFSSLELKLSGLLAIANSYQYRIQNVISSNGGLVYVMIKF